MKPEKNLKTKKEETSIPSVSLLIKSPIQVLTGPNWLDIDSPFMSTFFPLDHRSTKGGWNASQGGGHSFTRKVGILHKEVAILHREVGNPSQGGGNPSQGGGNPSQGGGILDTGVEILHKEVAIFYK